MRQDSLSRHFEAMGARVRFTRLERRPFQRGRGPSYTIDIQRDRRGPFFDFALTDRAPEFEILQTVPKERHLLLLTSRGERYLCGHDERHWFVSGIEAPVSSVHAAKRALMPAAVLERAGSVKPSKVDNRRNRVFKRQGEWFFIPVDRSFDGETIHRDEPLRRNARSKAHICEELVRAGGTAVYIVGGATLTEKQYRDAVRRDPAFARRRKEIRVANAGVYVRGRVSHADHSTIFLEGWHHVHINRELTRSSIAFLD